MTECSVYRDGKVLNTRQYKEYTAFLAGLPQKKKGREKKRKEKERKKREMKERGSKKFANTICRVTICQIPFVPWKQERMPHVPALAYQFFVVIKIMLIIRKAGQPAWDKFHQPATLCFQKEKEKMKSNKGDSNNRVGWREICNRQIHSNL